MTVSLAPHFNGIFPVVAAPPSNALGALKKAADELYSKLFDEQQESLKTIMDSLKQIAIDPGVCLKTEKDVIDFYVECLHLLKDIPENYPFALDGVLKAAGFVAARGFVPDAATCKALIVGAQESPIKLKKVPLGYRDLFMYEVDESPGQSLLPRFAAILKECGFQRPDVTDSPGLNQN